MYFKTIFYVTYKPLGENKETHPIVAPNMEEAIKAIRGEFKSCHISEVREGCGIWEPKCDCHVTSQCVRLTPCQYCGNL
jgi:hypothetical protein